MRGILRASRQESPKGESVMPRFFTGPIAGTLFRITGPDATHIAKSLRMRPGESLTLCDGLGLDYQCVIQSISPDAVEGKVLERLPNRSEPTVQVTLYQGIPKSDKMDLIVQKAVELGVGEIVPILTSRCVSRPDHKSMDKKVDRWGKISEEAAKQSGRGRIPPISPVLEFKGAVTQAKNRENQILFLYEGGGLPLKEVVFPDLNRYALFVGPEGGFSQEEAGLIQDAGGMVVTLGPRILRTETAPLAALAALMYATGNME